MLRPPAARGFDEMEQLGELVRLWQFQFFRFHPKPLDLESRVIIASQTRSLQNMAERAQRVVEKLVIILRCKAARRDC